MWRFRITTRSYERRADKSDNCNHSPLNLNLNQIVVYNKTRAYNGIGGRGFEFFVGDEGKYIAHIFLCKQVVACLFCLRCCGFERRTEWILVGVVTVS